MTNTVYNLSRRIIFTTKEIKIIIKFLPFS